MCHFHCFAAVSGALSLQNQARDGAAAVLASAQLCEHLEIPKTNVNVPILHCTNPCA